MPRECNPPSFDPTGEYRFDKLQALLQKIPGVAPPARSSLVVDGSLCESTLVVEMPRGMTILVELDEGLPEALYQVARYAPEEGAKPYPFEHRRRGKSAFTDKLSGLDVLAMLRKYMIMDVVCNVLPAQCSDAEASA